MRQQQDVKTRIEVINDHVHGRGRHQGFRGNAQPREQGKKANGKMAKNGKYCESLPAPYGGAYE